MPFIPHNDRVDINAGKHASSPGEICYVFYKDFVKQWNKEPRWATIDKMYQDVIRLRDSEIDVHFESALDLAWQVFFVKYAMPYEDKKEQENGSI